MRASNHQRKARTALPFAWLLPYSPAAATVASYATSIVPYLGSQNFSHIPGLSKGPAPCLRPSHGPRGSPAGPLCQSRVAQFCSDVACMQLCPAFYRINNCYKILQMPQRCQGCHWLEVLSFQLAVGCSLKNSVVRHPVNPSPRGQHHRFTRQTLDKKQS